MDDSDIVSLFLNRNENAVSEAQKKYGGYCYSIAYNILGNREDADESVNDAFLGAWNSIPPHKPQLLSAFLGRITRNLSLKKCRERSAEKRGGGEAIFTLDELEECIPSKSDVEDEISVKELSKTIDLFLRSLPKEERRVFLLRYWYFYPISEICSHLGCGQSRVKMSLFRTRKKLYEILKKEGVNI